MKTITLYGTGCSRCQQVEELVRRVLTETGSDAAIEKVTDYQAMAAAGVMATPAIAIDGIMKLSGRMPKTEEIRLWVQE